MRLESNRSIPVNYQTRLTRRRFTELSVLTCLGLIGVEPTEGQIGLIGVEPTEGQKSAT
ncbi:MAG: hypothetical protein LH702_10975 [Phormidesmis sp. CAN_BIN44]|nr:hypothetical protein [Phormidesmis sp. CAN_BIN44]